MTEVWYSNLKSFYKKIVKYINYTVMAQALYSCGLSVDQQSIILLTGVIKLSCSVKITDKKNID